MPTYDYRCVSGHKYERREPFGSPSEHACERCGKTARRVLNAPPLVFKGGGFYKTESRNGSGSSSSSRSSSSSSASSSSSNSSNGSSKSSSNGDSAKSSASSTDATDTAAAASD